jgi:RepB DNA-primase from phage plasmid
MVDDSSGKPDTGKTNGQGRTADPCKALAMLNAFASVGATAFDVSLTDIEQEPVKGLQRPGENIEQLRRRIGRDLQDGERNRHNVIIRPRSTTALLVQLDDFSAAKTERMEPFAFMTVNTSPGNYQVWLAVSDGPKESDKEAAKQFRTRVRKGAGADKSATGATRIAGSLNFKKKYAPDFPMIAVSQVNAGRVTTIAALDQAGLIAEIEQPKPPASVPPRISPPRPAAGRRWPDYQQSLKGAPLNKDGTRPDRSLADFMWCKWAVERGWTTDETAAKLLEVSEKAQERVRRGDEGYASLTARNAAAAVERERGRQQGAKPALRSA